MGSAMGAMDAMGVMPIVKEEQKDSSSLIPSPSLPFIVEVCAKIKTQNSDKIGIPF